MASIEQMVEALKFMVDQQAERGDMLLQQQKTAGSGGRGGGDKHWSDINQFRSVKIFGGDSREWEEFAEKFKSQVAATNVSEAKVLDDPGTKVAEAELEEDDFAALLTEDDLDEHSITLVSSKMHNLVLHLTTGEANAVVRRCRGRHGLLAWRKLCASLNPRTFASGVKAISQAMNPPKTADAKRADMAIVMWEDRDRQVGRGVRRKVVQQDGSSGPLHDVAEGSPGEGSRQVGGEMGQSQGGRCGGYLYQGQGRAQEHRESPAGT
jgi:hypothetical protein